MDTKRPPALTSPWKIGFLVALLLVFLSVGVNYLIFRTFNLSWTCIGIDRGHLIFQRDQFLNQLFPLVVLVVLASLVAYFSITAAVRRYKTFLDSGHDYRNLIRMIREATDLDNENIVSGLKKYPELREVLNSFRERIHEKEKLIAEREKQFEKQEKTTVARAELARECSVLVKAIEECPSGGRLIALGLGIPELAPVEKALRSMTPPAAGDSSRRDENEMRFKELGREIRDAHGYLRHRLEECAAELHSGCSSAQDIEKQLSELCGGSAAGGEGAAGDLSKGDLKILHQLLDTVENLSETLNDLGEEAKGVAINTALQAGSGEGALADLIQLAEDVRRVAIKFTDVAMSYQETVEQMRKSISDVETEFSNQSGGSAGGMNLGPALSALKSKVSLLVERMIILSDQFKNIEETAGLSMATIEEKLSAGRAGQPGPKPGPDRPGDSPATEFETGAGKESADDFEIVSNVNRMFKVDRDSEQVFSDDAADKGIPGLENQTVRIFSKSSEENEMFTDLSKTEESGIEPPVGGIEITEPEAAFEELPPTRPRPKGGAINLPTEKAAGSVSDFAEETMVREFSLPEEPGESPSSLDEFMPEIPGASGRFYDLNKPDFCPEAKKPEKRKNLDHNNLDLAGPDKNFTRAGSSRPAGVESGGIEDEETVIDLYALGAVDYVS